MGQELTLCLWRGDASGGELVDYRVPVEEGEVVLDAIHRVQATQAGDLAVRWNCKAGRCGSCSAEVNGRPRLLCMARLSQFPAGEPITVTPLATFPSTPTTSAAAGADARGWRPAATSIILVVAKQRNNGVG